MQLLLGGGAKIPYKSTLYGRYKKLKDKLFYERYITINANRWVIALYSIRRKKSAKTPKNISIFVFRKILHILCKAYESKVKIFEKYFSMRFILGFVDIPHFELVLTTSCSLRCESCNNLMQYFSPNNQYKCTFEGIISTIDALYQK
ncbi:hypothetical protein [Helicobacter sp. CLO-3]|uniref:hypothetical protein n=1 Tax=Helicobacter sp. CLO-3 TaxID=211 RepID=UPI000A9705CB|nr:hypothetical protein [Helicobacter sp. CLO-3]